MGLETFTPAAFPEKPVTPPQETNSFSAGERLEMQLFKRVSCDWDNDHWIKVRGHNKKAAFQMLDAWVSRNGVRPLNGLDENACRNVLSEWVKQHQPEGWNPHDPPKIVFNESRGLGKYRKTRTVESTAAIDLFYFVRENLGVEDADLAFYSSAGTPLDTVFGVDGFFEWKGIKKYLDLTKNREKLEHRDTWPKNTIIFTLHDVNADGEFQKPPESDLADAAELIALAFKEADSRAKKLAA